MRVDREERIFAMLTARELLEKLLDRGVRKGPPRHHLRLGGRQVFHCQRRDGSHDLVLREGREVILGLVMKRFWSKVDRQGPDECWMWTAGTRSSYGAFRVQSKMYRAHRVAWCLENDVDIQTLSPKTVIRHECDNRPCCNPAHLLSGSQQDNIQDMLNRERSSYGEDHYATNLSEEMVREIRRLCEEGLLSQKEIACLAGIGQSAGSLIHCRKNWIHTS